MPFSRAGSSPRDAIILDFEEPVCTERDREIVDLERRVHNYQPRRHQSSAAAIEVVDEEEEEDIASRELADIVDLTIDDEPIFIRQTRKRPQRVRPQVPERLHDRFQGEILIKVNKLYELDPDQAPVSDLGVCFIRVTSIVENLANGDVTIRGMPFCRSRTLMAKLPRKLNEIFALYEQEEDDDYRSAEAQATIEVPASALIRPRTLHLTNAPYPAHRYQPLAFSHHGAVEREGPLVCRWKFFVHYKDSKKRAQRKAHHWTLERVRADDVKRTDFRVDEDLLRSSWRGMTTPGGSYNPRDDPTSSEANLAKGQLYTVFDSFSGAGGFSRGAERAGLKVKYAVDHWQKACASYKLNFPDTQLFETSVDDFLLSQKDWRMHTDILHLSPPCQTWSPAHTIPGANDEANIAALFACRSLVEKMRPRIFTLEQTFGILQRCHDPFFCSLVGGFTEFGYSVTWKIVHLQTWGLPQTRKRLIMIGACPGEKLPPFPTATHSETGLGGLSKHVTIRQALRKIDHTSTFHNPEEEIKATLPVGSVVSDPDEILRRCVTCSGGQNMHWSNTRAYTVREFASLQGFPVWHKFAPASKAVLKRQIGNAFPACVVRHLCTHLKNWLLEVDGLAPARPLRSSVGGRELVFVSERPRLETPPHSPVEVEMADIKYEGGSPQEAITIDEDDQMEIKFDYTSDAEMEDVPLIPPSPRSMRSATLSLPGTPEPPCRIGCESEPILID
ncbi:rip defective [Colletotrichum plurivorum]|uniref:DNA (cytosine-5-)-methyltransferase n=1 Tax=Colletotrichum plurivorum TaxID=2175906 RepID=A0A8H6KRR6_9PEZI|nr:rip defective [Colletotrichum plurivorum]